MELFPKEYLSETLAEAAREIGEWQLIPENRRKPILLSATLLLFVLLTLYLSFYLFPQQESQKLAGLLGPHLAETRSGLGAVHTQMTGLFQLITGQEVQTPETARLDLGDVFKELEGSRVAGAQVTANFYDLLLTARGDIVNSQNNAAQMESQNVLDARVVGEKAQAGKQAVSQARGSYLLLLSEVPSGFPTPLRRIEGQTQALLILTDAYLQEAQRTVNFYAVTSEIQIELVPTTVSLVTLIQEVYASTVPSVYLGKIADLSRTILSLEGKLKSLNGALPEGMEKLHEDNLSVFSLLNNFLSETKEAVAQNDQDRFNQAVVSFEVELGVLANRAKTYELNFWQKTKVLKGYAQVEAGFNSVLEDLAKFAR